MIGKPLQRLQPLFEPSFLGYLSEMRLSCDIDAVPEGTVLFPYEPLVRVKGPIGTVLTLRVNGERISESRVGLRVTVPETGVDGEKANSWEYCRRWVDRVEPFFVCMLGQPTDD